MDKALQAMRRTGIGGSDIGAILGLSRWKSPYDIWLSKVEDVEEESSNSTYWGNVLEDVVASEYQKKTGLKIQRVNQLLRHPVHNFAIANIDRAVINPDIAKRVTFTKGKLSTDRILECKTANGFYTKEWGDVGTDEVPDTYFCQVQWYLAVTGAQVADLAVLIGGNDFRIYHIERDDEAIHYMLSAGEKFWQHVIDKTPPQPTTPEEAIKVFPHSKEGKVIYCGAAEFECCTKLNELNTQIKALEEEAKKYKTQIMLSLGDAEELNFNGQKIASWKTQGRTSFDSKRFKEEMPDTYQLYTKTSNSRVLRLNV